MSNHYGPYFVSIYSPMLIDAITAAQTEDGQKVLMDTLKFNLPDEIELPERYLLAVAFSTHPSQIVLKHLLVRTLNIRAVSERVFCYPSTRSQYPT